MELLKVKVQASSIEGKPGVTLSIKERAFLISCLGASIPVAVEASSKVTSIPMTLSFTKEDKGREGVVAIKAYDMSPTSRSSQFQDLSCFLSVAWREGKAWIDLVEDWVPSFPGRVGVIVDDHIEVVIDDVRYTSDPEAESSVVDGDTLCQYLAGDIDAEAVEAAATERKEEIAAQERVAELTAENDELEHRVLDLRGEYSRLEGQLESARERVAELEKALLDERCLVREIARVRNLLRVQRDWLLKGAKDLHAGLGGRRCPWVGKKTALSYLRRAALDEFENVYPIGGIRSVEPEEA